MIEETVIAVDFGGSGPAFPEQSELYTELMATIVRFDGHVPVVHIIGALELAKQTLIMAGVGVELGHCPDLIA